MAWPKSEDPRKTVVSAKYTDKEMAEIAQLMKREKISKSEAVRRLSFPSEVQNEA